MGGIKFHSFTLPAAVILLVLLLHPSWKTVKCQNASGPVPAMFIFGDSLVDVGNNNYIGSLAKANFYPNGIDFPGGRATGRFCNGKTVLDFICDYVGLPYPPPNLAPGTGWNNIVKGVNYASGAGGILDSTGSLYVQRISLNQQLRSFGNTVFQLNILRGPMFTTTLLNKALFAVVIGSNDYINNYLQTTGSPTKNQYTPQAYQQLLINTLSGQLRNMYLMGARKILVANVGPLGCIPDQIAMVASNTQGSCLGDVNGLVVNFNSALEVLISSLNSQLPGAQFVYGNVYDTVLGLVNSPGSQGFSVANSGCCGLGRFNGQFPCLPAARVCQTRSSYVFWDPFHPTDSANRVLASRLWSGGQSEVTPMNVQALAAK